MLEAVWDPVQGKVVYVDPLAASTARVVREDRDENVNLENAAIVSGRFDSSKKPAAANKHRRSRGGEDEVLNLQWRTGENVVNTNNSRSSAVTGTGTTATSRRRSRDLKTPSRRKSHGVAPQQFHKASPTTTAAAVAAGNDSSSPTMMQSLRREIQERVITQQTRRHRKHLSLQRQYYASQTVYKTYPVQDQAILHFQQLRKEWGVAEVEDEHAITRAAIPQSATAVAQSHDDIASSSSSYLSSSSSSSLSDDGPEAKRSLRDRGLSPAQSQSLEQFKLMLQKQQQQRYFHCNSGENQKDKNGASPIPPALWCMEPRVFGVERIGTGQRQYVVAHAGRFLDAYWRLWPPPHPARRHVYELIRPHTPCRLYLDIEASATEHAVLARDTTVQEQFLTELFAELAREWQIQYQQQQNQPTADAYTTNVEKDDSKWQWQPLLRHHVVDLDSSTATKFSRHWIVHLPMELQSCKNGKMEALFPDASAVGTFVRTWVGRLAEEQATGQLRRTSPTLQQHLFFTKSTEPSSTASRSDQRISCVIDTGVYTRNRLFRILGSCKYGKPATAALRIADTNQFPFPVSFGNHCFYAPAMETCAATQVDWTSDGNGAAVSAYSHSMRRRDDDVDAAVEKTVATTDWTAHAEALAETLVVPLNSVKNIYVVLPNLMPHCETAALKGPLSGRPVSSKRSTMRVGQTPYAVVDEYVLGHLAAIGGVQGTIRAWSLTCDPNTQQTTVITYEIGHNRFCECIGRPHKSNHIAWQVDVRMGQCYQTCHDPECRALGFRGSPVPLPSHINADLQELLFDEELGRLEVPEFLDLPAPPPPPMQSSSCQARKPATTSSAALRGVVVTDSKIDDSFDLALASLSLDDLVAKASESTDCLNDHDDALFDANRRLDHVPPSPSAGQRDAANVSLVNLSGNYYNDDSSTSSDDSDLVSCLQRQPAFASVTIPMSSDNINGGDAGKSSTARPAPRSSSGKGDDSDSDDDLLTVAKRLERRH